MYTRAMSIETHYEIELKGAGRDWEPVTDNDGHVSWNKQFTYAEAKKNLKGIKARYDTIEARIIKVVFTSKRTKVK